LTDRELEILQLAADGISGRHIAERLVISPATVKTHFANTYRKLRPCVRPDPVSRRAA
jgi:ATP/maltotriose-dependent transcriptional regulator MalT